MIKANELRIGNNYMVGGQLITATAEDILKCRARPTLRRPIPLTTEILEKCGFKDELIIGWYSYIVRSDSKGNWLFCVNYTHDAQKEDGGKIVNEWYLIYTIKYLHQLQNLYHALTGEELTYNAQ